MDLKKVYKHRPDIHYLREVLLPPTISVTPTTAPTIAIEKPTTRNTSSGIVNIYFVSSNGVSGGMGFSLCTSSLS